MCSGVERSTTTRFSRPGVSEAAASRQAEMRDWMSERLGGGAVESVLSMAVLRGLLRREWIAGVSVSVGVRRRRGNAGDWRRTLRKVEVVDIFGGMKVFLLLLFWLIISC
jgi:hypothetical protein